MKREINDYTMTLIPDGLRDVTAIFQYPIIIWRAGLWQKLLKHGIRGKILTVIQNMYKEIKSCITVNGNSSGFFSCEKGVRQGENLSPLLFAIYLNDLETYMDLYNCKGVEIGIHDENALILFKLFFMLYADYTIILSDDVKHFQDMLNVLVNIAKIGN